MRFTDENKRTLYNGDWNNIQPRFGLAFALDNKTSLRAGYGLFYTISRHTVKGEIGSAFQADSGIQWSLDSGRTQFATWENPWPVGLTTPPGRNATLVPGPGRRHAISQRRQPAIPAVELLGPARGARLRRD